MIEKDESKSELLEALLKASAEFKPVKMSGYNPAYHSRYATRQDLLEATEPALTKYGLRVIHTSTIENDHEVIITRLWHKSGEFIESKYAIGLPITSRSQERGSARTYALRYEYASILCLAAEEEDDGNIADKVIAPPEAEESIAPPKEDVMEDTILLGDMQGYSKEELIKLAQEFHFTYPDGNINWKHLQTILLKRLNQIREIEDMMGLTGGQVLDAVAQFTRDGKGKEIRKLLDSAKKGDAGAQKELASIVKSMEEVNEE